jgi:two-component system sensor histidine kinase DegS
VVQETLTNVAKHADAKHVDIALEKTRRAVRLTVTDDGKGFDYQEFLKRPRRRKEDFLKLGLLGLRERMELLGGTLSIKTAPGRGTTVTVEVPV